MQTDYQAVITAPFGKLGVRAIDGILVGLDFLPAGFATQSPTDTATRAICDRLSDYFTDGSASLDLDCRADGTAFQQRVWQALRSLPAGSTVTYGELAASLDSGSRAVANACGANPIPLVIPCHRVVAKHGIGGFMQGRETTALNIKQWLLQHERSRPAAA